MTSDHWLNIFQVSLLFLVPPLLVFLSKHPLVDQYDLSSVSKIYSGAAPLSEQVQRSVKERIPGAAVRQGYGMTETAVAILITPPGCTKYGSSGKLAPGLCCKVSSDLSSEHDHMRDTSISRAEVDYEL